jgi:hypothetical protein
MSETTDGELAPLPLTCTGCGADIDAPDREFVLGPLALVPYANQALVSVRCLTCETDHDVALWTLDQQLFISETGSPMLEGAGSAEALALLERYHAAVDRYRRDAEARYDVPGTPVEVDLSEVEVAVPADRFAAAPMAALAACRGIRQVVAARPGAEPPAVLLLGHYRCIVSVDRTPERPYPHMHVSVGNAAVPGHLPEREQYWLLSLFFTPGEMPFLDAEPGRTVPVLHYYLPAYAAELDLC